jgi:hypothetical protein
MKTAKLKLSYLINLDTKDKAEVAPFLRLLLKLSESQLSMLLLLFKSMK